MGLMGLGMGKDMNNETRFAFDVVSDNWMEHGPVDLPGDAESLRLVCEEVFQEVLNGSPDFEENLVEIAIQVADWHEAGLCLITGWDVPGEQRIETLIVDTLTDNGFGKRCEEVSLADFIEVIQESFDEMCSQKDILELAVSQINWQTIATQIALDKTGNPG
jgi:hypothetical protein